MHLKKRIFKIRPSEQKLFKFKVWLKTVFSCQKVTIFSARPKKPIVWGSQGGLPPSPSLFEHLKDAKSNIWTLGKVQARIIPIGIVYTLYQHFHKTFVNILPQKAQINLALKECHSFVYSSVLLRIPGPWQNDVYVAPCGQMSKRKLISLL